MSGGGKIRVLIADDHSVVRFGLSAIIGAAPDMAVIGEACNGQEAVEWFRRQRPDVTLMDLRMPVMNGVEAIRILRAEDPNSRFIVLTTYHGDEDIHKAVSAGARAYLLKGMSHEELVQAIRSVHSGLKYFPPLVLESLENRPASSELSDRGLEILRLIVKGLTNRQIADTLGITEGTVKWHVNGILGRLNVEDRTQAAVAALHRGIVEL
jgi:DNA-binding NarL/FixJ family response regulator